MRNRAASEFGNRWGLIGLDRLIPQEHGVSLEQGDGNMAFFWSNLDGTWKADAKAGAVALTGDWTTGFTLRDKRGNESLFDGEGLLTMRRDAAGNETVYSYLDADGDGAADELSQITDPSVRTKTLQYTAGLISKMTVPASGSPAGRDITFQHDSGRLVSYTLADPDGAGRLAAPTYSFAYDAASGQMLSATDAENNTTAFAYDFAGTLETITKPRGDIETLRAVLPESMVDLSSGVGSHSNPAPLIPTDSVEGSSLDHHGQQTTFTVDRFGFRTSETDVLGNTTTYERDHRGRVTRQVEPDPDGAGPLTAPETLYQYDAAGNLTQVTHPDGAVESWTYDATFNVATSYTGPLGHQTLYELDGVSGLVLEERRVVGQDDRSSGETDDVVTTFTYTSAPAAQGDPPAGLVETITDPLGRLTQIDYNAQGQTTQVTYAVGTAVEASIQLRRVRPPCRQAHRLGRGRCLQ